MRILILLFVIVFSIGIIIPSQNVESILENDNYTLEGNGFLISDKNIETSKISIDFSIRDSGAGKTLQFEEGSIQISGKEFKIMDNFKARLLKDVNLFRFNGLIDKGDTFVILGKIVGESKEGNIYSMRGVVKADNITKQLAFSGQMIKKETILFVPTIEQQEPLAEIEIKSKPILFVKQPHRTDWQEEYVLTARVFDANKNPNPEFYDNFGFLPGVDIFVNITHELGIPLTTFEGQTDDKGYFNKQYHITENLVRTGKYFVHVVADNGITSDSKDLVTFIFSETAKGNSSGP